MMTVLAGDWPTNRPAAIKKNLLCKPVGLLMPKGVFGETIAFAEVVSSRDSLAHRAGWAALGAVALGPVGLLAGAVAASRTTVAVELRDGRKALLEGSDKDVAALVAACS